MWGCHRHAKGLDLKSDKAAGTDRDIGRQLIVERVGFPRGAHVLPERGHDPAVDAEWLAMDAQCMCDRWMKDVWQMNDWVDG